MAGWLDELFNGAQFKGQDPKGLLEMLSQLAQTQAGPSAGFPAAGPPQMSAAGGGSMMPLPLAPAPDLPPPKDIAALPQPPANLPVNPNFPPDAQGSAEPPPGAVSPAAAMAPPPGAAPFFPGQDVLARIGHHVLQTLHDNSNSMIAGGGAMISGGLGHGLSAMAAAAPLDIAARKERQGNQAIQATYEAVLQHQLAAGVPLATARANAVAASQNKEILKDTLGPQFQHVERKGLGGETEPGVFDPRTGTYKWGQGGGGGGMAIPSDLQGQELSAWLQKNRPDVHNVIEGMYSGNINPDARNLQAYIPYAERVHPDLQTYDYKTRAKTRAFYTSGPGAMEAKAANTVIDHARQMSKIDERLGGVDFLGPAINPITSTIKGYTSSDYQDARKEWDAKSETLAVEVAKAIGGGQPHVAEVEHWRKVFSAAGTPTERKAAIRSALNVVEGRRIAAEQAYEQGMGPASAGYSFISPENKKAYEQLLQYGHTKEGGSSSAAPAVPDGKRIGETREFKQGTGVWNGKEWVPKK